MPTPHALDELKAQLRAMLPELRRRWPISYLGLDVDLVPRKQLKPFIGAHVMREVQSL